MRHVCMIGAIFLALTAILNAQVETTFKTVADGQDEHNGQPIDRPDYTLTGGGGEFSASPPPIVTTLDLNTDYTVWLHEDRIDLDRMYKHHDWDGLTAEFRLVHDFNSGSSSTPVLKRANFLTPNRGKTLQQLRRERSRRFV